MGVGKNFLKIPTLECVIRRNGKHSYRKGYLTEEKFRLYAQSPMAEDVTIGNTKLQHI